MSTRLRAFSVSAVLLIVTGSIVYSFAGNRHWSAAASDHAVEPPLVDAPLAPGRERLLDVAFEAASAIPEMPHIKSRSKAQEVVVDARLELDQPQRAQSAIEKIENWRRGVGYADLAFYCAQKGDEREARRQLALATQMTDVMATEAYMEAADDGIEGAQAWRRDRIRARIARTLLFLGDTEKAAEMTVDLEPSEVGPVEAMKAKLAGAKAFEQRLLVLRAAAQESSLEGIQSALIGGIEVYQAVYAEPEKRLELEKELEACSQRSPAMIRTDLYARLVDCALAHQDSEKALEFVGDARFASEVGEWHAKDGLSIAVRLAALRYRAGDQKGGRAELDAALATFNAKLDQISDMDRAETLCPIAEAYQAMGDSGAALTVYRRAVEEGAKNLNAMPRAEDLASTLASMALHGVEPDQALWERITQIRRGLRDPW